MIDEKELRVGNYFRWSDYASMGVGVDQVIAGRQISEYNSLKEPIPLTEEWLMKFSFNKDGKTYVRHGIMVDADLDTHLQKNTLSDIFDYDSEHYYIGKLEYVHQLQNLFYVFTGGEELTIKESATEP